MRLITIFIKNRFFFAIAAVILIALCFPGAGLLLKSYGILNVFIFLGFLITGLTLDTSSILDQLKNLKVLLAALFSSLFLFPVIGYFLARIFFEVPPDFAIGVLIISAAPATIASGTVMTAIALGNIPLSLFICVLTNFASIMTIPFLLTSLLQYTDTSVELPALDMLFSLVAKVLVPILIGQVLRSKMKLSLSPFQKKISILNQSIVLMIVLNAVAGSAERILGSDATLFLFFLFMSGLHVLMLCINFGLSRIIHLDLPSTAAFTIHTSQKTLTISYIVWADQFYHSHPMALIPPIVYHLTQIVIDTWVAHRFRNLSERSALE